MSSTCNVNNRYSGRWDHSLSNRKLFPVISQKAILDSNGNTVGLENVKHAGHLFKNAHHNKSKKMHFSYLVKNRAYLRR
jgi:hypothetical protein